MKQLRQDVNECTNCNLCERRHKAVFGEGNENADILFIGEAPGANEDIQGKPFVGRAGDVLNNMLRSIELEREDIFITNIVKCRPPKNRTPNETEIEACRDYLDQQIEKIDPRVIVCLGQTAATTLLGLRKDMTTFVSSLWQYGERVVVVTYHPAATLYRKHWVDKLEEQFEKIQELVYGKEPEVKKIETKDTGEAPYLGDMRLINDTEDAIEMLEQALKFDDIISFDTETTGLNYKENHIIGFSIGINTVNAVYIPIRHRNEENVDWKKVKPYLKVLLEDPNTKKILHNAKFDWHMLDNEGIGLVNYGDTMLLTYCIDENIKNKGLKELSKKFINPSAGHWEEKLIKIRRKLGIDKDCCKDDIPNGSDISPEAMYEYACIDVILTLRLHQCLWDRLDKEVKEHGEEYGVNVVKTYERELLVLPVLKDMEAEGVAIDIPYLAQLSATLVNEMAGIKKRLTDVAGEKFNLNSTQQIGRVLVDKLGFYPIKRTMKGNMIVDEETIAEYYDCEWTRDLRRFRSLSHFVNTYIIPMIVRSDGVLLRTSLHHHRANNGRLSSSKPNLQNIPNHQSLTVSVEEALMIRKAFINYGDEWVLLFADYNQIELRIGASYANISPMIEGYKNNDDIHKQTTELIYKRDIKKEERIHGKTANFAFLYGGGVKPFMARAIKYGIPVPEDYRDMLEFAEVVQRAYHRGYPQIKIFLNHACRKATERGWVKNHFGRIRRFLYGNEWNAFQFVASSTAADIIKDAMVKIHNYLKPMKSKMVMQIHDELIFKVHKSELEQLIPAIRTLMEYDGLAVPITVDMETSEKNWAEREKVK